MTLAAALQTLTIHTIGKTLSHTKKGKAMTTSMTMTVAQRDSLNNQFNKIADSVSLVQISGSDCVWLCVRPNAADSTKLDVAVFGDKVSDETIDSFPMSLRCNLIYKERSTFQVTTALIKRFKLVHCP
jgi:hypothetical protein